MANPMSTQRVPTGPAAAALLASGIGVLIIGVMTTGAEISPALKDALNWHDPAGPLAGKTTVGVAAWLIAWVLLRLGWKGKEVNLKGVVTVTLVLIALGLVLTFPLVFAAFQTH